MNFKVIVSLQKRLKTLLASSVFASESASKGKKSKVKSPHKAESLNDRVRSYIRRYPLVVPLFGIAIVIFSAVLISNYLARNTDIQRSGLTNEEKNLAEQLDKQNNIDQPTNTDPFQPDEDTTSSKEITYTVKEGDSLSAIASTYLGDGNYWTEIASLNNIGNPDQIEPGQELKIPSLTQETVGEDLNNQPSPQPESTSNQNINSEHIVRRGETLWSIAEQQYGSGFEWYKIAEANKDRIQYFADGKPWIEIGVKLTIPLSNSIQK